MMEKINPARRYGLIGFPVKHSFSAAMHNAAFKSYEINARYELFEVSPDKLDIFLRALKNENICGINVTIPHKENSLRCLDKKSVEVEEIGAVNTIRVNTDGTLKGFNTDYAGFTRHLEELGIKAKKAALIGAGGAAKAVSVALAKKGTSEIAIYDVEKEKSFSLAERIKNIKPDCNVYNVDSVSGLKIEEKNILVNASPVGMKEADPCLVEESVLRPDLFVYDLIYNPEKTKLLQLAESKGLKNSNGLMMLLYQGMLAFEHWTGQSAPKEIMYKALLKELKKCSK